ncbi:MAG: tRNA pseudouridine(55) synthase TruB [Candidatus Epulonipiscioides saccharophilum]|nr:MAG: tRNA pseudouridine(55) synthase TruB [Epulopiscium sp. AS2M-Bin001]
MDAIINIYKEKGFTSHDVVAKARGILKQRKIGHTGTLDPNATGVLPICVGEATKIVSYLSDLDKSYEAEVILGAYTTTEDSTGEIVESFPVNVTNDQILNVLKSFLGEYNQIPPMYSAIKINGQKLYELARQNIIIDRPSRKVKIFDLLQTQPFNNKTNTFKIKVTCSKGTYIRTLCTDIGHKLACGAYMGELIRTRVGNFDIKDSITLSELEKHKLDLSKYLISLESMFLQYPKIIIDKNLNKFLYNGNPLTINIDAIENAFFRVYDYLDHFVGLYKWKNNKLVVEKKFFRDNI